MEDAVVSKMLSVGSVSGWALVLIVLLTLIKVWPTIKELQQKGDGSLRVDLMARIDTLEKTLRDERAEFEEAMRAERSECDRKMNKLQADFNGLLRQFITLQITTARALPPADQTPVSSAVLDQLVNKLGYGSEENHTAEEE